MPMPAALGDLRIGEWDTMFETVTRRKDGPKTFTLD